MRNQKIADRQVIEVALQEGADRVIRRADDRLLVHVEAGVDQRGNPGQLVVLREDSIEAGMPPRPLRAGGASTCTANRRIAFIDSVQSNVRS